MATGACSRRCCRSTFSAGTGVSACTTFRPIVAIQGIPDRMRMADAPPGVVLAEATPADAAAVAELDAECFEEFWRYGADELAELLSRERCTLAETADGEVIGYTLATVSRGAAVLSRLCTAPRARRLGVGAALLSDVGRWCRQTGASTIALCTQEENAASRALYASAGLVEIDRALRVHPARDLRSGGVDGQQPKHAHRRVPRRGPRGALRRDDLEHHRAARLALDHPRGPRRNRRGGTRAGHRPLRDAPRSRASAAVPQDPRDRQRGARLHAPGSERGERPGGLPHRARRHPGGRRRHHGHRASPRIRRESARTTMRSAARSSRAPRASPSRPASTGSWRPRTRSAARAATAC